METSRSRRRRLSTCSFREPLTASVFVLFVISFAWNERQDQDFYPGLRAALNGSTAKSRSATAGVDSIRAKSRTVPSFEVLLFPESKDQIITRKVLNDGLYEQEMIDFIQHAFSEPPIEMHSSLWAVDLGANVGFHTLFMAALGVQVVAFEPSPDTAALLRESKELNGYSNLQVVEAAASDHKGSGRLSRHPDSPGMTSLSRKSPFGIESAKPGSPLDSEISIVRADAVLEDLGVLTQDEQRLRLLKIDVEGYELHALKGLDLDRYRFSYLTVEFFPAMLISCGTDPVDLLYHIQSHGYRFLNVPELGLDNSEAAIEEWGNILMNSSRKSANYHVNLYAMRVRDRDTKLTHSFI